MLFSKRLPAYFTLLICSLLTTSHVIAQHFKGGPLLGINASQVDGDTYYGYNKAGLMFGAFIVTPINNLLDIQLELKYMSKGSHKKATEEDYTSYTSHLNYLEMPVLLRLKTKNKIDLEGGIGIGYLFKYSEENEYGTLPAEYGAKFKNYELSSLLGIGYWLTPKLSVNLRYSYSIMPIVNYANNPAAQFFHSGAYNNLFSLGAYYTL